MGTRIDALGAAASASRNFVLPAMLGGVTVKLTVGQIIDLVLDSPPGALDTLNELAAALGDDPNFSATVMSLLGAKAASARTISGGGLVSGGGDLTANRTLTVTKSSQAQALAGSDDATAMTPARVRDAVAVVEAGSVSLPAATLLDVTGIPAGVRRLTVSLLGASLNGTSSIGLRLGTSSGVEATGYSGTKWDGATGIASSQLSTEFPILTLNGAANVGGALVTLVRTSGNIWQLSSGAALSNVAFSTFCNGWKSLAGALDRIRLFSLNGSDTFDAGSCNVMWEF